MRSLTAALALLALALGACKDNVERALAETTTFKDRLCACTDKPCVDAVYTSYLAWRERTRAALADDKPSAADDYKGRVLHAELEACRRAKLAP